MRMGPWRSGGVKVKVYRFSPADAIIRVLPRPELTVWRDDITTARLQGFVYCVKFRLNSGP